MDNNIVKKKIKLILILVLTLLTVLSSTIVIFVSEKQNYVILQTSKQNVANSEGNENSNKIDNPELNARIALIYDRASGRIIYEKNGNKQTPMASTTKILTSIVILENADLKETVTIGSKAAGTGGSRLGLKKNDKITVNDLLYGLMLRSGNDAAVALALHVGGSIEGFADMMNKKAEELGLTNSHFVVPHGLDNEGHYTTAYELAKMADYALNIPKFKEIVSSKSATIYINGYPKAINNTNNLLGSVSGVYGVKTGFTNGAGRCLVSSCKRGELDIITVVIGANTNNQRTADTKELIEYAFNNYSLINIGKIIQDKFEQWKNINEGRIYVNKGIENGIKLYLEKPKKSVMAVRKDSIDKIDIEVNSLFYMEAPVAKDQVIGNLRVIINGEEVEVKEIRAMYEIEKKGIEDYLQDFLNVLVLGTNAKNKILWYFDL
mgnify:FL=1